MASSPIPFRLPPALLKRLDDLASQLNLSRADIVRLSLLRVLEVAEKNPAALMQYTPELLAMDGRRSASMSEAAAVKSPFNWPKLVTDRLSARVADAPDSKQVPKKAAKPVNYRKALADDRRKARKKNPPAA